jgi:hypothetical protein
MTPREEIKQAIDTGFFPDGSGVDVATNLWLERLLQQYDTTIASARAEAVKELVKALKEIACMQRWPQTPENMCRMMAVPSQEQMMEIARKAIAAHGGE